MVTKSYITDDNIGFFVGLRLNTQTGPFLELRRLGFIDKSTSAKDISGHIGTSKEHVDAEIFYRLDDEIGRGLDLVDRAGPRSLIMRYVELGGDPRRLAWDYSELFGEELTISRL